MSTNTASLDITELSSVSEDEGIDVPLKDVLGEPMTVGSGESATPLVLRVAGAYSDRYRAAQKKLTNARIQAAKRGKGELDADALDDSERLLEAACILAWPFTSGGQPYPITAANWSTLLSKQPQWQAQVWAAMHDHAGFFGTR